MSEIPAIKLADELVEFPGNPEQVNRLSAYHEIAKDCELDPLVADENHTIEVVAELSCHRSWRQEKHEWEHPYFQVLCAFQGQAVENLLMPDRRELPLVNR